MVFRTGQVFCLTILLLALPLSAQGAKISDLISVLHKDTIVVSFRMSEAFGDDIDRAIGSGLPVSFRFTVQLQKVRTAWFNKKVAERQIRTTVTYDNLTERFMLSRELDGEIDTTEVTSDLDEMRRFMTTIEALELFDTSLLEPNGEYLLKTKGIVRDRTLFLFIPWDVGSGWEKTSFTYLP